MTIVSTTTLANGSKVELSTGDMPRNGTYDLVASLYDNKGTLVRAIVVDTAANSDGTTSPPRGESFSNMSVVGLSNGGFVVAYDDTSINPPGGGSNLAVTHFYDAAGVGRGMYQVSSSNGGQPFPSAGNPKFTADSTGGGVVVTITSDFHAVATALTSSGVVKGSRMYDARPDSVYTTGPEAQVVVTLTKTASGPLATPIREVLNPDLTLASSSAVTETRGTENGDALKGGANADNLFGLGGDDTLQGGAGFDVLTGGAGHDRFVFAVDGSVDQVTDFDASQDTLALVDASGAPLNAAAGVLTFWRGTGALTYDPDGDLGPAAAQTVAMLPGVKTLTASNFAPGYEPAVLRIYNPITPAQVGLAPGSRSDLTFGFGKAGYVSASADYSVTGTLLTYGVSYADGTSTMQWFDTTNAQPWKGLAANYDAKGQLLVYATHYDDGTHMLWNYDVAGTQTWQRTIDHYDAQGRYTSRDVVNDDGSRFEAVFDVAGTQPWGYAVEHFTAAGVSVGRSFFNDDGSPFH